jgi:hypothetical protein
MNAPFPPKDFGAGSRYSSKLEAALDCAARGFRVFPCKANSKEPLIGQWQIAATTHEPKIRAWAAEFPGCNWGMVLDNKAAVDIDPRNGGASTFNREWKDRLSEDPTLVSQTASGGAHLIYALPEGVRLKSRPNAFGPGVDLKSGSGAYLVAPGSVIKDNPDHPHCDGEYRWLRERPISCAPTKCHAAR